MSEDQIIPSARPLEAKCVFLDTCIWRKNQFQIARPAFETLVKLSRANRLRIVTTDITLQEIGSQIEEFWREHFKTFDDFRRTARLIGVLEANLQKPMDSVELNDLILQTRRRLNLFYENAKARTITLPSHATEAVFRQHFLRQKPFSEKKKYEFKDAFVIQALMTLNEMVYVISEDTDYDEAHPSLIRLKSVDELLDIYNSHVSTKQPEFLKELIQRHTIKVRTIVTDEFHSIPIEAQGGYWKAHSHSELLSINEIFVLSYGDTTADVSLDLSFIVNGEVVIPEDPWQGETREDFTEVVDVTANLKIQFDLRDPDKFEVLNVVLDAPTVIRV